MVGSKQITPPIVKIMEVLRLISLSVLGGSWTSDWTEILRRNVVDNFKICKPTALPVCCHRVKWWIMDFGPHYAYLWLLHPGATYILSGWGSQASIEISCKIWVSGYASLVQYPVLLHNQEGYYNILILQAFELTPQGGAWAKSTIRLSHHIHKYG